MLIPIDQIHDSGDDVRRIKASADADAALTASIGARGVLQPIVVRPNGNGYLVVFGRRRLRCARAAGLGEIAAEVREMTDTEAAAADAAENMVRERLHPLDQWRAVKSLIDLGMELPEIATSLGLDTIQTRRAERLGRLHPAIVEKIKRDGLPNNQELRVIANASSGVQAKAAKRGGWWDVAQACKITRILRDAAIFPTANHPALWVEDLFAEPDDNSRFSTTDIDGFMTLQRAALESRIAAQRAEKRRVQIAEIGPDNRPVLPKGWKLVSTAPKAKPGRTESAFAAIRSDGTIVEVIAEEIAAKKAAERKTADRGTEKPKPAAPAPNATAAASDDAGDDPPSPQSGASGDRGPRISKTGMALIAEAKTAALHERLIWIGQDDAGAPRNMLCLVLLALLAENVEIRPRSTGDAIARSIGRLLLPGGTPAEVSDADLAQIVGEVLAAMLSLNTANSSMAPSSGAAAEWIGAWLLAGQSLPRFDTEAFLAALPGDELREAAASGGIKSTGTVIALRARLVGNLPNWRPAAAQFGAPAPVEAKD
jgi:ParB family chromosome partitioning protein